MFAIDFGFYFFIYGNSSNNNCLFDSRAVLCHGLRSVRRKTSRIIVLLSFM